MAPACLLLEGCNARSLGRICLTGLHVLTAVMTAYLSLKSEPCFQQVLAVSGSVGNSNGFIFIADDELSVIWSWFSRGIGMKP